MCIEELPREHLSIYIFIFFRLIERSPTHDRSVSPIEYHDLQTKTLMDLLKNISEEAEDYASSNSSIDKGGNKSPMVNLSRQLKSFTKEHQHQTAARGPMGNIPIKKQPSNEIKPTTTTSSYVHVNVIEPSPVHSIKQSNSLLTKGDNCEKQNNAKTPESNETVIPMIQIGQNDKNLSDSSCEDGDFRSGN